MAAAAKTRVFVGLGGNQGSVVHHFRRVVRHWQAQRQLVQFSHVYRTRAVGAEAGGDFLNAVVELNVAGEPLAFLDNLQELENQAGRERTGRWHPRPLDLDLLAWGDLCAAVPRLTLPHPAAWYRRFVLEPWSDLAGGWRHPQRQRTIADLRDRLRRRPLRVALTGLNVREHNSVVRHSCRPAVCWSSPAASDLVLAFHAAAPDEGVTVDLSHDGRPPVISAREVLDAATGAVTVTGHQLLSSSAGSQSDAVVAPPKNRSIT